MALHPQTGSIYTPCVLHSSTPALAKSSNSHRLKILGCHDRDVDIIEPKHLLEFKRNYYERIRTVDNVHNFFLWLCCNSNGIEKFGKILA